MKKISNNLKIALLILVGLATAASSKAQSTDNMFLNFDWQMNTPLGNDFANQFSGWGASADAGYYITDHIGVGAYIAYHTNRKYIDKQTFPLDNYTDVTTDQQHALFQLPFGVQMRYSFTPEKMIEPYFAIKAGTMYSKMSSYMNVFEMTEKKWGFNVSPEIGTTIFFDPMKRIGIHLATYYSYSTNKSSVLSYDMDGISNWGVRVGLAF